MGRLRGAAANIVSLPDPFKDEGVDPESRIRFVPSTGRAQPEKNSTIVPVDAAKNTGEFLHYADPATGKVETARPLLRREMRRHRNDIMYGEVSRVCRDYETFRTNEFHWRGSPPSPVAYHYGKNPRHIKYDGTHAIDHDRVAIDQHLKAEAWDACAKYTQRVEKEVAQQEFENMLVHSADIAHDKSTTQYSNLRNKEEKESCR